MKYHLKIIKKLPLWSNSDILVKRLDGGITNYNYLIQDGDKKYVARFAPQSNILLGLNRKREIYNTKIASSLGIGPNVTHFFPEYNLLILEYMEGNIFSSEAINQPSTIKAMEQLLKRLHNGPKFRGEFNPFKTVRKYIRIVKEAHCWLPDEINKQLSELKKIEKELEPFYKTYPCHLDLMIENILENKDRISFLDWEYSSNSDYRFDLAMLSVKGKFTPQQDRLLLKAYDKNNKDLYSQIQRMKAVVYFREAAWGFLQLAISKIKFDYKKYAVDNLELFVSLTTREND